MCEKEIAEREKIQGSKPNQLTSNVSLEYIGATQGAPLTFQYKKGFKNPTNDSFQTLEQEFGVNIGFYAASDG
jgi:hypothetical protein